MEETYKDQYTVAGRHVLYQAEDSESMRKQGEEVSLYQIDGVIASDQELAQFRMLVADNPGTVTEKTVTTYHTEGGSPAVSDGYLVPGGNPAAPTVYVVPGEAGYWLADNDHRDAHNDDPSRGITMTRRDAKVLRPTGLAVAGSQNKPMERIMQNIRTIFLALLLGTLATISLGAFNGAWAATPDDLNRDSDAALHMLITTNPAAANVAKNAKAVLIFPNIVKAGLIFGGAYGEGELKKAAMIDGYYNTVTASWGFQAGAQSYGYVVFLMNDKAINYIHQSHGWEIGTGPTVVVVNEGVAKNLTTSTLKDDAYAFIFDQQGLMASLSLEGTKISLIKNP